MSVYFDDSVAILQNDGMLEIILPYAILDGGGLPLFNQYSAVHSLHVRDLFGETLTASCMASLGGFQVCSISTWTFLACAANELVELFQDPRLRLSELRL